MKLFILTVLMCSSQVFAHGDHSAPGAIPPSPNGGTLGEAKHEHKGSHHHDHKEANEREIFFEAKLKNKELTVYPLELDHKTGNIFKALKVKDFSEINLNIKDPRKKSVIKFELEPKNDHWKLKLDEGRARRIIVGISGIFKEAKYKASVQVERK